MVSKMQMFGYIVRDKIFLLGSAMPLINIAVNYFYVMAVICQTLVAFFLLSILDTETIFTWK